MALSSAPTGLAFSCPPEAQFRPLVQRCVRLRQAAGSSAEVRTTGSRLPDKCKYQAAVCINLGASLQLQSLDRTPLMPGQVRIRVERLVQGTLSHGDHGMRVTRACGQCNRVFLTPPPSDFPWCYLCFPSAAINFADVLMARGEYQVKLPTPFVGGGELSGTVIETTSDVGHVTVGQHVVALPFPGGAFAEVI